MTANIIDINCDLGEGLPDDALLMPLISSCNVACGGHFGDRLSMLKAVQRAKKHNVLLGAHPSYPDKKNFGRTNMDIPSSDLETTLMTQIKSFMSIVESEGLKMHHIKPHGALYNKASYDVETADVIIKVIATIDSNMILYAPYRSVIDNRASAAGLVVWYEAFADRGYRPDLSLVKRGEEGAILPLSNVRTHVEHIINGSVSTSEGLKEIQADTLCIHGDHPEALEILKSLQDFKK